ncbi:head decoration protein [Jeotgalibacillus terrae]|uniref:Head decoration protein n=1 Tax=Jeotgalibacillus terrae TaxID=587735 RepID=A0ABW5ZIQ6_9BACL|nr:head decoration protein [Jeotgalibacillus terrae]MBM7580016.1 hypothetical protein [Jeotgalibacillus terrae]
MPEQFVQNVDSFEYDNLLGGGVSPIVTDSVELEAGAVYLRGTVLGVDDTGLAKAVDSVATDGSQVPYAILAKDVDATDESLPAPVYLTGEFNQTVLIFGGTDTFETHKPKLREIGIFLKDVVKA